MVSIRNDLINAREVGNNEDPTKLDVFSKNPCKSLVNAPTSNDPCVLLGWDLI